MQRFFRLTIIREFLYYSVQALIILFIAFFSLKLYDYNLKVPFQYSGDSIIIIMYIKSIIQNGWTFEIPQLSAPYSMHAAAFPLATSTDWALMKIISFFTSEVGLILNLFWLMTLVFSAWSASFSIRILGGGQWFSLVGGVLFAFLPFALLRNVAHLNLVYYAVPLLALLAICIANEQPRESANNSIAYRAGYVGCLIQGFNYIYFSFFAILLFIFAAFVNRKSKAAIKISVTGISIICVTTFLNLAPSFMSWYQHGKPPEMDYKYAAESEIFGAKIRKMISPHPENPIPFLAKWGVKDVSAKFPNENENTTARLGLYASLGFLLLLAIPLNLIITNNSVIKTISVLSLFAILMITVGGFGAIFNLLIVPDIRCYNRFSVFIGFFSIAAMSLWAQLKIINFGSLKKRYIFTIIVTIFGLLSLYDQLLDKNTLVEAQQKDIKTAISERKFIYELEKIYPDKLRILQLPITGFPPLSIHEKMVSYDHLRPYIWSSNSYHWSWPSFSNKHRAWQEKISSLQGEELLKYLVFWGFDLIWIDRYAYKDSGDNLVKMLVESGAKEQLAIKSDRYAVLDIQDYKKKLLSELGSKEFERQVASLLDLPVIEWISGVYPEEYSPSAGKRFRWSQAESEMQIRNMTGTAKSIILSFMVASGKRGNLIVSSQKSKIIIPVASEVKHVELPMMLEAHAIEKVRFIGDMGKINLPPGEKRDLNFYLMDLRVDLAPMIRDYIGEKNGS